MSKGLTRKILPSNEFSRVFRFLQVKDILVIVAVFPDLDKAVKRLSGLPFYLSGEITVRGGNIVTGTLR